MSDLVVHICRPASMYERAISTCPVCKHHGRIVGMVQVWYGTTWTCCNCGDSWEDGELLTRPFSPGWRERAIQQARKRWAEGVNRRQISRWIDDQLFGEDS